MESEISSRWDLLEHAFSSIKGVELIDADKELRHLRARTKRTNITGIVTVIEGYQQGRYFYCGHNLYDVNVDHVIPRQAIGHDQVWNLVLAQKSCNEDKSDFLPSVSFIENLIARNEYYIASSHPLKETLISDLGKTTIARRANVLKEYGYAKRKIQRFWRASENCDPSADAFYKLLVNYNNPNL